MNVQYINPFIEASKTVLKEVAGIDITLGKIYVKTSPYTSSNVVIIVGITGTIKGQAVFSIDKATACKIASVMMMGSPVNELDEMAKSALSELGNMIMGNTATVFYGKGLKIDITPPTLLTGDNLQFSLNKLTTVSIPLNLSVGGIMEIDISFIENTQN
ncbi:chemotaxis protein CheX [Anaerobacterium chartisolvens]|uniref:Chemotaxis protein CheX n=1 Tax=Anaerobacterium chartisolvens TaxID=1297424 RepID=A0A369AZ34_9FIRM|nr:chemotaxis protein CheX [Anaerobacterium chartisolvens]RCX12714.1 chemotaxis protein CheX [Anaerobacterium chartisolvens]